VELWREKYFSALVKGDSDIWFHSRDLFSSWQKAFPLPSPFLSDQTRPDQISKASAYITALGFLSEEYG